MGILQYIHVVMLSVSVSCVLYHSHSFLLFFFSSIHPLSHLAFLITVCVIITTVWRQFPTSPGMVPHFSGNFYACFKTYSVLCTVIVRFFLVSVISPFSPFPLDMNYHFCIFVVCVLFVFFYCPSVMASTPSTFEWFNNQYEVSFCRAPELFR